MVDSCVQGAGVISTVASEEEIQAEARWAETRGWTSILDPVPGEDEHSSVLVRGPPAASAPSSRPAHVLRSSLTCLLVAEGDGSRLREIAIALVDLGSAGGLDVTIEICAPNGPVSCDLRSEEDLARLEEAIRGGRFDLLHCEANFSNVPEEESDLELGRRRLAWLRGCSTLCDVAVKSGVEVVGLLGRWRSGCLFRPATSCDFLQYWDHLTVFEVDLEDGGGLAPFGWFSSMPATDLQGQYFGSMSKFKATIAERYLKEFSRPQDPARLPTSRPPSHDDLPASLQWARVKAPPIGVCWDALSRWRELLRLRWRVEDHNNLGELRVLVLTLRRLVRSSLSWDRRFLVFSDSQVSLGAVTKGRSASWPLLRLTRMAAACQLLCGIRPYVRYVESKRNHADGPSRGFPIGQAPPWASGLIRRTSST